MFTPGLSGRRRDKQDNPSLDGNEALAKNATRAARPLPRIVRPHIPPEWRLAPPRHCGLAFGAPAPVPSGIPRWLRSDRRDHWCSHPREKSDDQHSPVIPGIL